jgi:phosphoribosylpyrophosphate synthetase
MLPASAAVMSWKRAQIHAESMLENLGLGERLKGRKDLRGKKVIFVDDGTNQYRTMCFTIAAKLVKKRGADVETVAPAPGEVPHAKVVEVEARQKPRAPRPINRR